MQRVYPRRGCFLLASGTSNCVLHATSAARHIAPVRLDVFDVRTITAVDNIALALFRLSPGRLPTICPGSRSGLSGYGRWNIRALNLDKLIILSRVIGRSCRGIHVRLSVVST